MAIADYESDLPKADIQPMTMQEDPRGGEYGESPQADGAVIPALYKKLTSVELFRRGKEENTIRYKLLLDPLPDGTPPLDETRHLVSVPFEDDPLKVVSAISHVPFEDTVVAECERTV